ncbi:MAG: peptidoglycan-binding domain-containing protein [Minisyncoccia bacterium]
MFKNFFVFLIILSLFIIPTFVFANTSAVDNKYSNYSEEELLTLISKLQKQLEEVRNSKIQCNITEMDLSIGDGEQITEKEYVKNLQNFLKEKGYFKNVATGYFGKITRAALVNFQKTSGIEQSGELNALTRTFIKTLKCKKDYIVDKITTEKKTESTNTVSGVSSINLKNEGKYMSWSAVGYSKNGFKIVWSKNATPTYPTRDGDKYIYLSDPSAISTTLDAFNGSGMYYARVCEYLGGSCGVYSNQIQVSL